MNAQANEAVDAQAPAHVNVVDYLRERARTIHWYKSNHDDVVACGLGVLTCNSVEHTALGFLNLAHGQKLDGYCATCVWRAGEAQLEQVVRYVPGAFFFARKKNGASLLRSPSPGCVIAEQPAGGRRPRPDTRTDS